MAEITVEPAATTATVSGAASCSSRSGTGASASEPTEHLAAATADYSYVIEARERSDLLDDNFAEGLDLVDRSKASDVKKFKDFWPKGEYGKRAIGADARGLRMFTALKRAAKLAGRSDIVTQDDIGTFVVDELQERGVDLTRAKFFEEKLEEYHLLHAVA
ncbi:hypothetical protein PInf_006600 [Phytophthora infestans]|nr:hypothetical protein PInf_006600 [Phytophthora infestans]